MLCLFLDEQAVTCLRERENGCHEINNYYFVKFVKNSLFVVVVSKVKL